jgi:general L-amino acid transport system substrate-binding protein
MLRAAIPAILFVALASAAGAQPASVAERVKARGAVRCGSVERPGLAQQDGKGRWHGLEVDVCRAVAAAVLGSPDKFVYRTYETPKDFDALRRQQDDVVFLSGSEINEQKLAGVLVPGPTVFVESHGVMVPASSPVRHVADLPGEGVCFVIGSSSERSLSAFLEKAPKPWFRRPFSEEGEMTDAYNARNCHAVAGEFTTLASYRLSPGVNRLESRILPEPTTSFPLIAATGTNDAKWALVVAWTVATLVSGERPETKWYGGGAGAMPVEAPEVSLDKGWQRRVLATVGHYGEIFERNVGKGSSLQLERGLNANQADGGLLLSPFLD